jgi:maltooligosyltrehalose trehalohydrolase
MPDATLLPLGAVPCAPGEVEFRVWAPAAERVDVRLAGRDHPLAAAAGGVHEGRLAAGPGDDYRFVLDGGDAWPDPCSRWQPEGLRGPSRVLDPGAFRWSDRGWRGLSLDDLVVYELHVGAFSGEGSFDGVAAHLDELARLGVTAIEPMPIGTFAGERGWGYDVLYGSAPHVANGGPEGFQRLVDAAHAAGLGVIVDCVYNHLGVGSEAVTAFGPYLTDAAATPWGEAIDYAERFVREWAIQNALLWVRDYHVDGLRLDATHAIVDRSDPHVLKELASRVREAAPRALVISETRRGDLRPIAEWGHDAQWADELHHELHVRLSGEREGYYGAHDGSLVAIARELRRTPPQRLVVCSQDHDQVGNRALGDRPASGELRLRAATVLFAPQVPLLFMGEEYGERRPFRFFTDHPDPAIAEAARAGRRREFAGFRAFTAGNVPDPQARETFEASRLDRSASDPGLLRLYRDLLALRRELPREIETDVDEASGVLRLRRGAVEIVLNFGDRDHDGVPARDVAVRR